MPPPASAPPSTPLATEPPAVPARASSESDIALSSAELPAATAPSDYLAMPDPNFIPSSIPPRPVGRSLSESAPPLPSGPPQVGFEVGDIAPEIYGQDTEGEVFRLSEYRGKVVLLDFWGHW